MPANVGVDVVLPQQLQCQLYLSDVSVRICVRANWIDGSIPNAVYIVSHDVKPVKVFFHFNNIEALKIPLQWTVLASFREDGAKATYIWSRLIDTD